MQQHIRHAGSLPQAVVLVTTYLLSVRWQPPGQRRACCLAPLLLQRAKARFLSRTAKGPRPG